MAVPWLVDVRARGAVGTLKRGGLASGGRSTRGWRSSSARLTLGIPGMTGLIVAI
jgi:hypothetical protein